ncbi:hypothetical protein ACKKBG_A30480 [Auxenochlorella protothecoides x Auxenochlorella symbiontica]
MSLPQGRQRELPPKWVGAAAAQAISKSQVAAVVAAGLICGNFAVKGYALFLRGEAGPIVRPWLPQECHTPWLAAFAAVLVLGGLLLLALRPRSIYLLDFVCYRPPDELKVTYDRFMQGSVDSGFFDVEALDFQRRILNKSALSQETFFPPGLHASPPEVSMASAREEASLVMCSSVEQLLKKTGITARQVDVLVTNCSLFNPTPSLAAMVINSLGMRSDVDSYNLAGMGCSAGVLAVGLASKLLKERGRGGYALVVSTENITQNWYRGRDRSMLIPNTIFRLGAAAVLLTSSASERRRCKYRLERLVRVHLGADDAAYRCIFQAPDAAGSMGVALSKDIVKVAARAMTANLTRLGPLVLPWSEKLMFAFNWVARQVCQPGTVAPYVPDFTRAFDHFCLHAGGRGVVEGLSAQLGLSPTQMAPSANTLYWYGNTSSSTVWYSFGFCEAVTGVKRGDVVWQIAFGSGFKCNSAVWRALRNINDKDHAAWQHIVGREGEAMAVLAALASAPKEDGRQANGSVAPKQVEVSCAEPDAPTLQPSNGHRVDGVAKRVTRSSNGHATN